MSDYRRPGRSQRMTVVIMAPPKWFGWLGVSAMFLLGVVRLRFADGSWFFPMLSLGEWLLLPMGVASLIMGLLALGKRKERTLLPLWLSAIVPAVLWLAAAGLTMLLSGVGTAAGDMFVSWLVHLIFPTMAFLPLLAQSKWRDRLMWALIAGLVLNVAVILWQVASSGLGFSDSGLLSFGGLLANQHDYGLMLGIAVPLLAAWRGGNVYRHTALIRLICTFLLPALVLTACFSWVGIVAAAIGLSVAWASWRSHAWIPGIFLCLLVFGYGSETRKDRDADRRRLFTASASMGGEQYRKAFAVFAESPYFGAGPEEFLTGTGHEPSESINPSPWYATLLGGSGLAGMGMWLVLLAEMAARAMGRYGKRCMFHGGVLGGVAALAAAGWWTDALPEGAGAMVGFLLALSILDDYEPAPPPRQRRAPRPRKAAEGGKPEILAVEEETVNL